MSRAPPDNRCQVEAVAAVNRDWGWEVAVWFVMDADAACGPEPVAEHPDPVVLTVVPAGCEGPAAAGAASPPTASENSDATRRPRRAAGFNMTFPSAGQLCVPA